MQTTPAGNSDKDFQSQTQSIYYKTIKLIHQFFVSIRRNIVLFIVCMMIGITPMLIKYSNDAGYYKASFTVMYDELVRKIYGDRLAKINTLVNRKQYDKVATILQVPLETAKTLAHVEGTNILGEDLRKDLNTDRIPFMVNITVDDSSKVRKLQDGIMLFLETGNEYMADRKRVKLLENQEELDYIDKEMRAIDSLSRRGIIVGNATTTTLDDKTEKSSGSTLEFSYELYKRKQELLRKQRMPSGLVVIDDAIVSTVAQKSIVIFLAIGIALGLFLYTVLAAFVIPAIKFKD